MFQYITVVYPEAKRRKGISIHFNLSLKYNGIAIQLLNAIPKFFVLETSKVRPFTVPEKKRWTRQADVVEHQEVTVSSGLMVCPYP